MSTFCITNDMQELADVDRSAVHHTVEVGRLPPEHLIRLHRSEKGTR